MALLRTHNCGELSKESIGHEVVLNGWVQRRRDLGGVMFIDMRDRSGIVQVVFNPDFSGDAMKIADRARSEFVLAVKGKVVVRDAETINPNLKTGEIEVRVTEIDILNPAKTPPFFIEEGQEIDEQLRLKYRYLDLRRPENAANLAASLEVLQSFPRLPGPERFYRSGDTDPDQEHTGRCTGLFGAKPRP